MCVNSWHHLNSQVLILRKFSQMIEAIKFFFHMKSKAPMHLKAKRKKEKGWLVLYTCHNLNLNIYSLRMKIGQQSYSSHYIYLIKIEHQMVLGLFLGQTNKGLSSCHKIRGGGLNFLFYFLQSLGTITFNFELKICCMWEGREERMW